MGHASIYLGHLLLRMGHAHASEITTMRCGPQLARTQTMHRHSPPRRRQRRRQQIRRCPHAVRWTAHKQHRGRRRLAGRHQATREHSAVSGHPWAERTLAEARSVPVMPMPPSAASLTALPASAVRCCPLPGCTERSYLNVVWESRAGAKAVRKGMTANTCALRAAAEMRAPNIALLNPFAQAAACRSIVCTCER